MADQTSEQGARFNARIVGLVTALVTSVITVPSTYFINGYLDRDRVRIEATEATYEMTAYKSDLEKIRKLIADSAEYYRSEFNILAAAPRFVWKNEMAHSSGW